jgi:hypothetical protein
MYFSIKDSQWVSAKITTYIKGYGGSWYNVAHADGNRICVKLSYVSRWKFVDEERNHFYNWWRSLNRRRCFLKER